MAVIDKVCGGRNYKIVIERLMEFVLAEFGKGRDDGI